MTGNKRRRPQVGDVIFIDYGRDPRGQYWWRCDWDDSLHSGGPFATEAEARKHAEVSILGPQCKVESGGMWDPGWSKMQ